MKGTAPPQRARQFVESLASRGRYSFTPAEAEKALGGTAVAAKLALHRLARQGAVASPMRGFWVVVPPEYRGLGCLPASDFLPDLMRHLELPYYAGLLSAAERHGAAHHRPQVFQVFVEKPRRPLTCGRVRVVFMVRRNLRTVPVQRVNTPRGVLTISTPEATAIDLVGYERRAGGLNLVATVLAELAEAIDPDTLVSAATVVPIGWAQRLGYLLETVDAADKAVGLERLVRTHARKFVPLLPSARARAATRDEEWKLIVNAHVEAEA